MHSGQGEDVSLWALPKKEVTGMLRNIPPVRLRTGEVVEWGVIVDDRRGGWRLAVSEAPRSKLRGAFI